MHDPDHEKTDDDQLRARIRGAWQGRVSGCQLGKPVEIMSMREGHDSLTAYLTEARALPLRDYVPLLPDSTVARFHPDACKGRFSRSEPDDDINYSVLALMMLEAHGTKLTTADVARFWLRYLPGGIVFTAERSALVTLLQKSSYGFPSGADAGFDLTECSDNEFNDWIGAQIRADVYGWVCPGQPELAADLARRDAELSHRDEGVYGAMAVWICFRHRAIAPRQCGSASSRQPQERAPTKSTAAMGTCRLCTPSTTWRSWCGDC